MGGSRSWPADTRTTGKWRGLGVSTLGGYNSLSVRRRLPLQSEWNLSRRTPTLCRARFRWAVRDRWAASVAAGHARVPVADAETAVLGFSWINQIVCASQQVLTEGQHERVGVQPLEQALLDTAPWALIKTHGI